jgi:hypothetical protein
MCSQFDTITADLEAAALALRGFDHAQDVINGLLVTYGGHSDARLLLGMTAVFSLPRLLATINPAPGRLAPPLYLVRGIAQVSRTDFELAAELLKTKVQ